MTGLAACDRCDSVAWCGAHGCFAEAYRVAGGEHRPVASEIHETAPEIRRIDAEAARVGADTPLRKSAQTASTTTGFRNAALGHARTGRPRRYATNAERQRAYRSRQREASA